MSPHPSHALRDGDTHCDVCLVSAGEAAARLRCPYAPTIAGMMKRQYSREFTPKTERRVQFLIDRIPPTMWLKVKAKAKRDGVSLRALILGWLKEWSDDERAK